MGQAWLCAKMTKPVSCYLVSLVTLLWIFLTWWDPADLLRATSWHPGKDGQLGNSGWCTYSPPGCCGSTGTWCRHGSAIRSVKWKSRGWQPLCKHFSGSWFCLSWLCPENWLCLKWAPGTSFIWEKLSSCIPKWLHEAHCTSQWSKWKWSADLLQEHTCDLN